MQINVVTGDAASGMAMAYGIPHPDTVNYLTGQIQRFEAQLPMVPESVRGMFAIVKQNFNNFFSDKAITDAKRMLNNAGNVLNPNAIVALLEAEALQNASMAMQRWIMAEPTLRAMYHKQQCEGYADTYLDMEPGKVGDYHYDYRRVVDGIMMPNDEMGFTCEIWAEELNEGDRHLDITEQAVILNTWDSIRNHLKKRTGPIIDPTSPSGGLL